MMKKQRKPLSTKKPPVPSEDQRVIGDWMEMQIMPGIKPLINEIDRLIRDTIPDLHYAIKWGSAFYGTAELGWIIELAAYQVSANIVFLSGATFDPQPPLGEGEESRYIKIQGPDELNDPQITDWLKQAGSTLGWK